MNSNTVEKLSNKNDSLIFDDSSLPDVSIPISKKKVKELEKTLGHALMEKFKNEFNLNAIIK